MAALVSAADRLRTVSCISCSILLFCIAVLAGLLLWALTKEQQYLLEYARLEARSNFNKDMALRAWAAKRGGVRTPRPIPISPISLTATC